MVFDTLKFSNTLKQGGIEKPDVLSSALSEALLANIYTKPEVNAMIDQLFRDFEKRTHDFQKRTYIFYISISIA